MCAAVTAPTTYQTALTKVNDTFMPLIERQLSGNGILMDGYAKQCVLASLSAIHTALDSKGLSWNDSNLDRSNITQILLSVACLKLNAAASPREVYFLVRDVKTSAKDEQGRDIWKKQIEMGIEGDGNDAILARFGRGVKKVGQFWLVREGDRFEYPAYNGLTVEPPKWTPTGKGPVIRVVYPVVKVDDTVEFYISERDDVVKNLMAHINNNLMKETFGIAKSRYDASSQQKKEIDAKKAAVLKRAHELGLGALDDPDLQPWISPAWTDYHSRESMIIRKMRNNVVKKIPKDFGSAFVEMTYADQTDEAEASMRAEVAAHANGQVIDIDPVRVAEAPAAESTSPQATEPAKVDAPSGEPPKEPITATAPHQTTEQATLNLGEKPPY